MCAWWTWTFRGALVVDEARRRRRSSISSSSSSSTASFTCGSTTRPVAWNGGRRARTCVGWSSSSHVRWAFATSRRVRCVSPGSRRGWHPTVRLGPSTSWMRRTKRPSFRIRQSSTSIHASWALHSSVSSSNAWLDSMPSSFSLRVACPFPNRQCSSLSFPPFHVHTSMEPSWCSTYVCRCVRWPPSRGKREGTVRRLPPWT